MQIFIDFVTIIFFPIILSFQMVISGFGFNKLLFKENFNYKSKNIYLILSFIFFSNIFLLINFFYPLNIYINTFLFFLPLIFIKYLDFQSLKKIFFFSIKFAIFFALLVSYDNINRPDAGLYHYPFMSMLNSEKIIFGSANLHFRFAHISIIQYLSAGLNNLIFFDKGLIIIPALIYFCIANFFYNEIKREKNNNILLFVSYFILFQILYDMNRYSGYGNDVPAHLLFLICIYLFLKFNPKEYKSFFIISSISILIFQSKSTLLLIFMIPLIILILNKRLDFLFKKRNMILIFFVIAWFLKNVIISGCLLFPKEITCSDKVFWSSSLITNINSADKVSLENEARSKDHPNRIERDLNYSEYLKTNWRTTWIKGHGKIVILKKIFPLLFLITTLALFLYIFRRSDKSIKVYRTDEIKTYFILLLSAAGTLTWFENFPTYRYGSSYIISFIIFSFASLSFVKKSTLNKYLNLYYLNIIIALIFIKFLLKYDSSQNMWPNIYNYTSKKLVPPKVKKININNDFAYYKTVNGGICMYNLSPCTHFDMNEKLSFKIINNYKFFYLNL